MLAAEAGCDGILLSNHGGKFVFYLACHLHNDHLTITPPIGRQLELFVVFSHLVRISGESLICASSSLPPIELLHRIRKQRPKVFAKLEGEFNLNSHLPTRNF